MYDCNSNDSLCAPSSIANMIANKAVPHCKDSPPPTLSYADFCLSFDMGWETHISNICISFHSSTLCSANFPKTQRLSPPSGGITSCEKATKPFDFIPKQAATSSPGSMLQYSTSRLLQSKSCFVIQDQGKLILREKKQTWLPLLISLLLLFFGPFPFCEIP